MSNRNFPLGQLVATPGLFAAVPPAEHLDALRRHASSDWGDQCAEDCPANNRALLKGGRLFSAYRSRAGVKFWIITEADRSPTCILLMEEYLAIGLVRCLSRRSKARFPFRRNPDPGF